MTTGLRPPRVLNRTEDGQNVHYFETDFVCRNVRASILEKHGWSSGAGVVVWHKHDSAYKRIGNSFYFLEVFKGCEKMIFGGDNESLPSQLCGDEKFLVDRATSVSTGARPIFTNRGVVDGQRTSTGQGIRIGISTSTQPNPAMTAQELMSAWNTYLEAARQFGENSDVALSKKLFFHTRDSQGKTLQKEILTLGDLKSAFPRYFQFAQEFVGQSLIELCTGEKSNFFYEGVLYPTSYIGLWDTLAKQMDTNAIFKTLDQRGYTGAQINAIRSVGGKTIHDLLRDGGQSIITTGGGGGGGGNGGGTRNNAGGRLSNGQPWYGPEGYEPGKLQNITVQRSRNIFLTDRDISDALRSQNIRFNARQPVMYQVYPKSFDASGETPTNVIEQYPFDFAPSEISYSGFGGEWVTIDRSGGFPFVDWKSFKLLQISFSFLIANNTSPGSSSGRGASTGEGLDTPVTEQISKLQKMAQTPFPVMFYGLDKLLTNQFRYDESGNARGIQFVIQDLSINAQRRNSDMDITRAQAQITLQEIPIEKQQIIGMPVLRHKPYVPKEDDPDETEEEVGLAEDSLVSQPDKVIEYKND